MWKSAPYFTIENLGSNELNAVRNKLFELNLSIR